MIHSEHLRKADESYEIRHNDKGEVIHVFHKDGYARVFPTLHDLVMKEYFGEESDYFDCLERELSVLYDHESYNYYILKNWAEKYLQPIEYLEHEDEEYPVKVWDGLTFATDELFNAISDAHGNVINEDVDNQIAFYFDEETFISKTAEELYDIFKEQ